MIETRLHQKNEMSINQVKAYPTCTWNLKY